MSEDKEDKQQKWEQSKALPAFNNVMPILKSFISLLESERQRTLSKIKDTEKVLNKIKKDNRK